MEAVLPRIIALPLGLYDSQNFWDQMELISSEAIKAIDEELCQRLLKELEIDSNYTTSSGNKRDSADSLVA